MSDGDGITCHWLTNNAPVSDGDGITCQWHTNDTPVSDGDDQLIEFPLRFLGDRWKSGAQWS